MVLIEAQDRDVLSFFVYKSLISGSEQVCSGLFSLIFL